MVMLQVSQLRVPQGQTLEIQDVGWDELDEILQELGEHRQSRIAYSEGVLTIVAPLPEHESAKVSLSDFVKIVLDELAQNYISLGSTTFRAEQMQRAIEPDDCFYIQNYERVLGKPRIDLSVDPPPDLAIEIDLSSKTQLAAYTGLSIPELWRYEASKLQIYILREGLYEMVERSSIFPVWLSRQILEQYLARALAVGQGQANREFRGWVRAQLASPST